MKFKKIIVTVICLILGVSVTACGGKPGDNKRYVVYNGANAIQLRTDNMFEAIINAGKSSKSSDKYSVYDKEKEETIYKYSTSKFYKYRGTDYIGEETENDKELAKQKASAWAKSYKDAYVIHGNGVEYLALGVDMMPNSNANFTWGHELHSGSYIFMFSKYANQFSNGVGISYMKYTVRMSELELTYHDESTERGWNAYIFMNYMFTDPWQTCDIGIMNGWESNKGEWRATFNYNGTMIAPANGRIVTQMEYDEESGVWRGTDDLEFEIYATESQYVMNIYNITKDEHHNYTLDNPELAGNNDRMLAVFAASYCPVMEQTALWNARCKASMTNIVLENLKMGRHNANDEYTDADTEYFYPGCGEWGWGFSYGADNSNMAYYPPGTAGTYKHGGSYGAQDRYYVGNISYT